MREGLLPSTVTTVMRLDTTGAAARALTLLLGEILDADEVGIASFEDEPANCWHVELFFASPPDEDAIRSLIAQVAGARSAAAAVFSEVAARDWVASSLEGLKPVEAGRFVIHGSHDRARTPSRPGRIAIEIEAALAFGTGHHGTTRGCLLAFDAVLKKRRPLHVLDVGTGTGVLAIAAARVLKRPATASDIDPVAVAVAKENCKLNATAAYIRLTAAPGLRHPAISRGIPYDLIFANILNEPLKRLAPAIGRALAPDGVAILSGLLLRDVPGILSAYRGQGLALAGQITLEGWATLTLKRGGSGQRPSRRPA